MKSDIAKIPLLHNFGPFPDLLSPVQLMVNPKKLFSIAQKLNSEIFAFRMVTEPWIFLTGKEAVAFFGKLTSEDVNVFKFRERMYTMCLPDADMPENVALISRQTNKIIEQHFNDIGAYQLTEIFLSETNRYLDEHLATEGTIDDFYRFVIDLFTQVFGTVFLGRELFKTIPKDLGSIYADIDESLNIFRIFFQFLNRESSNSKEIIAKKKLVNYLLTLIRERKKNKIGNNFPAIIDKYIEVGSEFNLSDANIVWLYNVLQWSAIHYNGVHGFWLAVEMLSSPAIFAALMQEQEQFEMLDWDSIKNMQVLQGAVRESLRVNPVFGLPRYVLRNLKYKDYQIPKGTVVAISPYLEHQNPFVYVNPKKFDPLRWVNKDADDPVYTSFIPGGFGTFGCLGMPLTIHFLTTFWAVLLNNYKINFLNQPPKIRNDLLLLPPSSAVPLHYRKLV